MLTLRKTCVEAICCVPESMSLKALSAMLERKTPSTINTASLPSPWCAAGSRSQGAIQLHPSRKKRNTAAHRGMVTASPVDSSALARSYSRRAWNSATYLMYTFEMPSVVTPT